MNVFPDAPDESPIQAALFESLAAGAMIVGVYDAADVLVFANVTFTNAFGLAGITKPITFADLILHGVTHGCGTRIDLGDPIAFIADTQQRRRARPGQRTFVTDLVDGRWFWMTETLLDNGWITIMGAEITQMKRGEDELKRSRDAAWLESRTDVLTGVSNRRHTLEMLDVALREFVRPDAPVSIALIDLDGFKRINDQHGHLAGDAVLADFSRLCRNFTRRQDTVGRIGGEEFLIILPGASVDEAWPVMEALRQGVADSRPKVPGGAEIHYTFSAGVAAMEPSDKVEGLLRRADGALYRAKHAGRNRLERA